MRAHNLSRTDEQINNIYNVDVANNQPISFIYSSIEGALCTYQENSQQFGCFLRFLKIIDDIPQSLQFGEGIILNWRHVAVPLLTPQQCHSTVLRINVKLPEKVNKLSICSINRSYKMLPRSCVLTSIAYILQPRIDSLVDRRWSLLIVVDRWSICLKYNNTSLLTKYRILTDDKNLANIVFYRITRQHLLIHCRSRYSDKRNTTRVDRIHEIRRTIVDQRQRITPVQNGNSKISMLLTLTTIFYWYCSWCSSPILL